MDIQMPYISGLELIEQLKADEELKRTPIMAVTAYAAKGDEERIRDAGAEGYVSKPISLMRFIEAVRGLLEAPSEPDAAASELDGGAAEDAAAAERVEPAPPDEIEAAAGNPPTEAIEAEPRRGTDEEKEEG
jgi:DNA-binding response OmpR family regulator